MIVIMKLQAALFLLPILCTIYLLQLISVSSGFFIDQHQSPSLHDWNYQNQQGWQSLHRQCGKKAQSPIDIQRRHVIRNPHLKLHFYNYEQLAKFKIQNAHHTIKLNPIELGDRFSSTGHASRLLNNEHSSDNDSSSSSTLNDDMAMDDDVELVIDGAVNEHGEQKHRGLGGDGSRTQGRPDFSKNDGASENFSSSSSSNNQQAPYDGAPTIKLDWLDDGNNEYKLKDIHFHWGERKDNGSEHAIDGRRAAMEMHLVHIKHGLDKSKIGFTSDSVTVIAVLIESYRKSNADFNPIVNALNHINSTDRPIEIEYKAITDLLPNSLTKFYTYSGSLTTPPCYQVVNWIVMAERLYLNAKQIEMFRNLYSPELAMSRPELPESDKSEAKLMMPNIRQLQPLNNRTILASFSHLSWQEYIQASYQEHNGAFKTYATFWGSISPLVVAVVLLRRTTLPLA